MADLNVKIVGAEIEMKHLLADMIKAKLEKKIEIFEDLRELMSTYGDLLLMVYTPTPITESLFEDA